MLLTFTALYQSRWVLTECKYTLTLWSISSRSVLHSPRLPLVAGLGHSCPPGCGRWSSGWPRWRLSGSCRCPPSSCFLCHSQMHYTDTEKNILLHLFHARYLHIITIIYLYVKDILTDTNNIVSFYLFILCGQYRRDCAVTVCFWEECALPWWGGVLGGVSGWSDWAGPAGWWSRGVARQRAAHLSLSTTQEKYAINTAAKWLTTQRVLVAWTDLCSVASVLQVVLKQLGGAVLKGFG